MRSGALPLALLAIVGSVYFGLRCLTEAFEARLVEQRRGPGGPLVALEQRPGVQLTTGQWLRFVPALISVVRVARATRKSRRA